jgi:hypothetical protein
MNNSLVMTFFEHKSEAIIDLKSQKSLHNF